MSQSLRARRHTRLAARVGRTIGALGGARTELLNPSVLRKESLDLTLAHVGRELPDVKAR